MPDTPSVSKQTNIPELLIYSNCTLSELLWRENWWWTRAEQHVCSEPGNERTNTTTVRAVLVLESRTGCSGFRITSTLNREPFLSDTSDLRTDELMTLRMRVIFQANEKHIQSILLNIRKCDNINIFYFFKNMNVSNLCTLFSWDSVRL